MKEESRDYEAIESVQIVLPSGLSVSMSSSYNDLDTLTEKVIKILERFSNNQSKRRKPIGLE